MLNGECFCNVVLRYNAKAKLGLDIYASKNVVIYKRAKVEVKAELLTYSPRVR